MDQKPRTGRRMTLLMMSLWLMFPFGACSSMDGNLSGNGDSMAITGKQLDDWDIRQCLSTIRPHENPEHYYRRGRYLQDRNKHRLAIQEFKSAIAVKSDYIEAYNALGISCDITGDYAEAAKAYEGAILLDPDRGDILNNLGYSCLLRKNFDKAIACFEKAAAVDKDNPRYQNNLGLAYAENGQFAPALEAFRKTTGAADAHRKLAGLLRRNGNERAADEHLYLASALEEGRMETDKLLEQTVLPIPIAGIVEEDIIEEAVKDDAVGDVIEQKEQLKEIESVKVEDLDVAAIVDAVPASPVETPDVAPLPPSPVESSDLTVIPEGIQEEGLTAALETEEITEPAEADAEPVVQKPAVEIDNPEIEVIPASGKEKEPAVSYEPEAATEPAAEPGEGNVEEEGTMKVEPVEEPKAKVIAPLEPMAIPAPESKKKKQPDHVAAPESKASITAKDETVAKTVSTLSAAEPEKGVDKGIAVEIVSMKELEQIARKMENRLDKNLFRIVAGETAAEKDARFPQETLVYYCDGYLQEAWAVAKTIPGWQNMEKVPGLVPADIKIRAVLCRDLMTAE